MAAPITYSLGGKQYVAVAAGYGGSGMLSIGDAAAVKNYENNGRLLVFTLGGGEVPLPRNRSPARAAGGRQQRRAAEDPARWRAVGSSTFSARVATAPPARPPCCRISAALETSARGARRDTARRLKPNGMPNFAGSLTGEDVDVLYGYVSRGLHNQPAQHQWY